MPDHFHAIIFLDHYVGASLCGRPQLKNYIWSQHNTVCARSNLALGEIIGRFKSYTTTQYIAGVRNDNWKPFYEKLWQRGFYDRVVRNRGELFVIRKYICNNPLKKKS